MKWDSPEAGEQELDEEDEWQLYASAGYASAEVIVEADETEEEEKGLPILSNGQEMHCNELIKGQHFTEPPPKFTEASLIRNLESKGIGRPSTYASIIGTILERDYVRRDRGRITPTRLGIAVTEFLKEHFEDIVDVGFTAGMEKQLDDIAEGLLQWKLMLQEFYGQ